MALYLGYVQGGKHHPGRTTDGEDPQAEWKQFYVHRELGNLGIWSWCGRRITHVRVGKRRKPEPREEPALPNYIFMEMDPHQFMQSLNVKYLSPTMMAVPKGEEGKIRSFWDAIDRKYEQDERAASRAEGAIIPHYAPGELLSVVSGPFKDAMARFERMVQSSHDQWPKVQAQVEGLGAVTLFDPLDVKAG